jgi:hypothetical protein
VTDKHSNLDYWYVEDFCFSVSVMLGRVVELRHNSLKLPFTCETHGSPKLGGCQKDRHHRGIPKGGKDHVYSMQESTADRNLRYLRINDIGAVEPAGVNANAGCGQRQVLSPL